MQVKPWKSEKVKQTLKQKLQSALQKMIKKW